MTLVEAERTLVETRQQIAALKVQEDAAAKKLKAYFRQSTRTKYGRVTYSKTAYDQLDTPAVKAFLGKQLAKFLKTVSRETLSITREAA